MNWHLLHLCCLRKSKCLSFRQAKTLDRPKTCTLSPSNTHKKTEEKQTLRWLTFKCKIETMMLVMSLKYTPVTQRILCLIFFRYVRAKQQLNYSRQESEKQFAVYVSETSVTLKQGQQNWYKLVDPKQGYNNAKFEKPCLNSVCWKANDKVFVKSGHT